MRNNTNPHYHRLADRTVLALLPRKEVTFAARVITEVTMETNLCCKSIAFSRTAGRVVATEHDNKDSSKQRANVNDNELND
jgi:hypothetical protein